MRYSEILKLNNELKSGNLKSENEYKIYFLTNITINPIKEILEYILGVNNINSKITFSNFDNIVQESINTEKYDLVIIFWELSNILDGFHYSIENLSDNNLIEIDSKIKKDLDFVLLNLQKNPMIIFNEFTNKQFEHHSNKITKAQKLCKSLNTHVKKNKKDNVNLININDIFLSNGLDQCINKKFYYNFKALYTHKFFYTYIKKIIPFILSLKGKSKKVIIFDCDNTLWHGLVGENDYKKIEMSTETVTGKIYNDIQNIILTMKSSGIIIGICSKNNEVDVLNVLNEHPQMLIKKKDLSSIKINWKSKDQNLIQISEELNIGLDSFVFVDDSKHEIDLINNMLPEVTTLHVPEDIYNYPNELMNLQNIFFNNSLTYEDKNKTKLYNEQKTRQSTSKKFTNISDYLLSLGTKLKININNLDNLERLTQLTQKTNQFNLTTKRYSKAEMEDKIQDNDFLVFSLNVSDKFGIIGLTGLAIIKLNVNKKIAEIESFVLSCRIIGREIENYFINSIIIKLKSIKYDKCKAAYIKTKKNEIVSNFYDKIGFIKEFEENETKVYNLDMKSYIFNNSNLCEVEIE